MNDGQYFLTTFFGMVGIIGCAFAVVCGLAKVYMELRAWWETRTGKGDKGSTGAGSLD